MLWGKKKKDAFSGKVAWITGGSSGIGKALAVQLARQGASVILSARNEQRLWQVQEEIDLTGGMAKVLPLDLEDLEHLPAKVKDAHSLFGRIDYLVHCAGVAIRDFALNTSLEVDRKIMRTNYFGPIAITKEVLPLLLQQQHGHIVVVSSLSGKYGVPRTSAYAASKHALHGFFETLRSEIASVDIPITIIVPGIIRTRITTHALRGDGSVFGRMEKTFQSAYPVEKAARKIIYAIRRRKEEYFVGGMEGFTLVINRLSPWLLRRIIRNHPIKRLRKLTRYIPFGQKRA